MAQHHTTLVCTCGRDATCGDMCEFCALDAASAARAYAATLDTQEAAPVDAACESHANERHVAAGTPMPRGWSLQLRYWNWENRTKMELWVRTDKLTAPRHLERDCQWNRVI